MHRLPSSFAVLLGVGDGVLVFSLAVEPEVLAFPEMGRTAADAGCGGADAPVHPGVPLSMGALRVADRTQASQFEEAPLRIAEVFGEDLAFIIAISRTFVVGGVAVEHQRGQQLGFHLGIALGRDVGERPDEALRMDRTTRAIDEPALNGQIVLGHELRDAGRSGLIAFGGRHAAERGACVRRDDCLGARDQLQEEVLHRGFADHTGLGHVQGKRAFDHEHDWA